MTLTPKQHLLFCALYYSGAKRSEIAQKCGLHSERTVRTIIDKLGLSRPNPRATRYAPRLEPEVKAVLQKNMARPKPVLPPPVKPVAYVVYTPPPKSCQWQFGDKHSYHSCDAPIAKEGGSWCSAHRKIVFQPR